VVFDLTDGSGSGKTSAQLERFPAKWKPVHVKMKKTHQNNNPAPRSVSIGTEKAPSGTLYRESPGASKANWPAATASRPSLVGRTASELGVLLVASLKLALCSRAKDDAQVDQEIYDECVPDSGKAANSRLTIEHKPAGQTVIDKSCDAEAEAACHNDAQPGIHQQHKSACINDGGYSTGHSILEELRYEVEHHGSYCITGSNNGS
jgi:hypothetical protein